MIEIELPDGTIAEFPDGTPREAIERALQEQVGAPVQPAQRNPDGTYGQPPAGMVTDPRTGQMTERALMTNDMQRRGVSGGESAVIGGAQGATFGGADEAFGGLYSVLPGEGSRADRYDFGREYARAMQGASQAENPIVHGGAEMAGGVGTALTYGLPAMAGRGLGGAMVAGGGVGAAEGLGYGFLSGEGGPAERGKNALKFGTAGAALGAGAPLAVSGVKGAYGVGRDIVTGGVDAALGRGSQSRANRALARTLAKSGRTPEQIDRILQRAAQEGQPEFRAVDALGIPGQRRASAIARSGGDSSAEIRNFLDARQLDQPDRVARFVGEAFDADGATARAAREALKRGRDDAADVDFGAIRARGEPVDIRPVVGVLDSKIKPFEDANISSPTKSIMKRIRRQLVGKSGDATFELSDFDKVFQIRKDLRDQISALFRQGKSGLANDLIDVRSAMDNAMEAASGEYRSAMDAYRKSSRVMDAVEAGQDMARPSNRAADVASDFQRMSSDEQAAARVGYGDRALAKVEASAGGANRARPLTSSKAKQEADAMAVDPELLRRRVDREMDMFETRNIAAGGSRTADNLEDIADLQGADIGLIGSILRGDIKGAVVQSGQKGVNAATGMNDSTRKILADALMANDTKAFRSALRQVENEQVRKTIMDTVVRLGGIQNIDAEALLQ